MSIDILLLDQVCEIEILTNHYKNIIAFHDKKQEGRVCQPHQYYETFIPDNVDFILRNMHLDRKGKLGIVMGQ